MQLALTHAAQRLEAPLLLDELVERVADDRRRCYDHPDIALRQTRLDADGLWHFQGPGARLTRHALRQLCARLVLPAGGTVPAGYLMRCPGALAAVNLNYWLSDPTTKEQRILVRVREEETGRNSTVRAILSGRYAPVDHPLLLERLRELAPTHGLAVQAWSLDDERLTLRLLPNEDHPASLADPLRVGLHITNSEIGLGCVSIQALVTRLVCDNGLIVRVADLGGIQRRHVGRAGEDLARRLPGDLTRVLAAAQEAARRLVALRQRPIPRPIEAFLRRAAWEAELPPSLLPEAIANLEAETLYDLINSLTRVAQRLPVAERLQVETAVSRFLRHSAPRT